MRLLKKVRQALIPLKKLAEKKYECNPDVDKSHGVQHILFLGTENSQLVFSQFTQAGAICTGALYTVACLKVAEVGIGGMAGEWLRTTQKCTANIGCGCIPYTTAMGILTTSRMVKITMLSNYGWQRRGGMYAKTEWTSQVAWAQTDDFSEARVIQAFLGKYVGWSDTTELQACSKP